jgi:hypothetical protein
VSNTANNFTFDGGHPTDETGADIVMASTNNSGVHTLSVNVENGALTLSPTNLALDASVQSVLTQVEAVLAALGPVRLDAKAPGASQKVAVGAASAVSGAITGTQVRVVAIVACHVAFGSAPTAVGDGTCVYLPAGVPQVFTITSGWKVAAIEDPTAAAAGYVFITVVS